MMFMKMSKCFRFISVILLPLYSLPIGVPGVLGNNLSN